MIKPIWAMYQEWLENYKRSLTVPEVGETWVVRIPPSATLCKAEVLNVGNLWVELDFGGYKNTQTRLLKSLEFIERIKE